MPKHDADVLKLLDQHGQRLFGLLFRMTLRREIAEDLLQELTLRLLRSPAFGRAESPEAFATRAAVRLAIDWRRSELRRRPQVVDVNGVARSPESVCPIEVNEEYVKAAEAIARLPRRQGEVVALRYVEGRSFEEIAKLLGSTPHRVRGLCSKGITRLRSQLDGRPDPRPTREEKHGD